MQSQGMIELQIRLQDLTFSGLDAEYVQSILLCHQNFLTPSMLSFEDVDPGMTLNHLCLFNR